MEENTLENEMVTSLGVRKCGGNFAYGFWEVRASFMPQHAQTCSSAVPSAGSFVPRKKHPCLLRLQVMSPTYHSVLQHGIKFNEAVFDYIRPREQQISRSNMQGQPLFCKFHLAKQHQPEPKAGPMANGSTATTILHSYEIKT